MTLVVKLGSSIVAADDGELRTDVLDSVCEQVSTLEKSGERVLMVTSGAIARGIRLMKLHGRPGSMDGLQAASAVGQGDLFRAYESRLAEHETPAAQVLLTAADLGARTNYINARQTLQRLIDWGVVPIVNENDTTATDEISFGDNDFLAAVVAILMEAKLLVLLTNIDGLLEVDPTIDPEAPMISSIEATRDFDLEQIGLGTSRFGTGGMRSKVAAAYMASEAGISTVICNGTRPGTLLSAVEGAEVGTRIHPHEERLPGFKLWLRHAKPGQGRLQIDMGAAERLRSAGSSLLPVGIIDIEGHFSVGDAVDVYCGEERVGKGISNYSSRELRRVIGLKTDAVREVLPDATDEVIHRDHFVLG